MLNFQLLKTINNKETTIQTMSVNDLFDELNAQRDESAIEADICEVLIASDPDAHALQEQINKMDSDMKKIKQSIKDLQTKLIETQIDYNQLCDDLDFKRRELYHKALEAYNKQNR